MPSLGIEQAVNQVIRGLPVEYDLGKGKMVVYYLDPPSYLALHRQLDELSLRWSPTLLKITGRSCPTPRWFRWGMSSQVWTAMEFEMYAVKFRDELETFLHLIYRNRHALEVAPSGEDHSRRQRRRQEQEVHETILEEEVGIPSLLSPNIQATFQPAPQQVIPPHQIHRPLPQVTVASQIPPRGYSNNPTRLTHSRCLATC